MPAAAYLELGICIFWGSHQTDPTGPQPSRLWSLYDVTVSTLCPPPGSLGSKDRCRDATFHSQENSYFWGIRSIVFLWDASVKDPCGDGSTPGQLGCHMLSHQNSWQMDLHPAHPASFVPN